MTRRLRRGVLPSFVALVLTSAGIVGPGAPGPAGAASSDSTGVTTRVSVKSGGAQSDARGPAGAGQAAVSDDGQVVAFASDAANLVPGDTNGVSDVFVSQNGRIDRVSLGPNFTQADGPSFSPAISHNGTYVAFVSAADNLVPGDTNGALDVFVYDRSSSTVTRASVAGDGSQADGDSRSPSIDDSGLVVAFTSSATNLAPGDANGSTDVFVRTIGPSPLGPAPSTRLVSVATGGSTGNGASDEPSLSGDGTKVAFSSDATDLVAHDSGGHTDVFWRDLTATPGATELVSLQDGGTSTQGDGDSFSPSVSGDGDAVAFASNATNLLRNSATDDNDATDVYVRTRSAKTVQLASQSCGGRIGDRQSFAPHITGVTNTSSAGVAFVTDATNLLQSCPGSPAPDNNGVADVYFRPLTGAPVVTERVSIDPNGAEFNRPSLEASVSGDGQTVAFSTGVPDPATGGPGPGAEVFARHRAGPGTTAATTLLSDPAGGTAVGPAVTELPAISADGTTVAYVSTASDLVTDDSNGVSDVFVYDRAAKATRRVSVGPGGVQANGPSATDSPPAISADGQVVAFSSAASNLVAGDSNDHGDVFVYDRRSATTTRVSVGPGGAEATGGDSFSPALSADGRYVAFASDATNLVPGDTNNATDVFVYDRQARTTTRVSVAAGGGQAGDASFSPSLSADGSVVAFLSRATDLVAGDAAGGENVFVRDVKAARTIRVSSGGAASPALSADGRVVAFASTSATLVPDDTNGESDVFAFDRDTAVTERVSVGSGGAQADRASVAPAVSGDGRFVAFASDATNLVPGDTNQRADVFVRDRRLGTTIRVSVGTAGQADQSSATPSMSADGRFVAFQSAADNLVAGDTNSAPDIFVHDLMPVGGYWLVGSDGGVFAYGSAAFLGSTGALKLAAPVLAMAPTPSGRGYWLLAADGGVFSFGDAPFLGSMAGTRKLGGAIVGMAATPTGKGYWLVGTDGGVFAFGDAGFFGSTGGLKLARPIVGMAATPTGQGYWLAASDGGVFAFGDAAFSGSTGAVRLVRPVVGMAATPTGRGYWLVASDGGVFAFGDAAFRGSTGGLKLNRPVLGMAASPTGAGYWLVASDGGVFAFGDAPFAGSAGALKLTRPVVGMATRP